MDISSELRMYGCYWLWDTIKLLRVVECLNIREKWHISHSIFMYFCRALGIYMIPWMCCTCFCVVSWYRMGIHPDLIGNAESFYVDYCPSLILIIKWNQWVVNCRSARISLIDWKKSIVNVPLERLPYCRQLSLVSWPNFPKFHFNCYRHDETSSNALHSF